MCEYDTLANNTLLGLSFTSQLAQLPYKLSELGSTLIFRQRRRSFLLLLSCVIIRMFSFVMRYWMQLLTNLVVSTVRSTLVPMPSSKTIF